MSVVIRNEQIIEVVSSVGNVGQTETLPRSRDHVTLVP